MSLKLAIPSKGRLQEQSFEWFQDHGLKPERSGGAREYKAEIAGIEGLELVLLSAGEIPSALLDGRVQIGITGQDLVHEKLLNWENQVEELALMGFGLADLVLAVPHSWIDVQNLMDLDAVAADFRAKMGMRLRIATKYHRLVGSYLRANDVTNIQLVDSQGATEGAVANAYAEMIADITSTGETIRANHLKIFGEPILRSQAVLYAQKHGLDEVQTVTLNDLRARLSQADFT